MTAKTEEHRGNLIEDLGKNGSSLIWLKPDEIIIDPEILSARPLYDPEQEAKEVEELAKSMQRDSQLEPIVVRYQLADGTHLPYDGYYHLIAGRRRVDAAHFINAQKAKGEEPFRLAAVVNTQITAESAFGAAIAENLKRKNLSAIQFALVCRQIREEKAWQGGKNTKRVAELLQVSPATVTQSEKLLTLGQGTQEKIHRGELTPKAALDLADVKEEKRDEVFQSASRSAQSEKGSNAPDTPGDQPVDQDSVAVVTGVPGVSKKRGKKATVQSKHVRKAAREVEGALKKPKPRSRKEILEFFEMSDGPAYGYPNGLVRQFITYFLRWAQGEGTDRTLIGKFDGMTEKAHRGTADSIQEPKDIVKVPKAVAKKKKSVKKAKQKK